MSTTYIICSAGRGSRFQSFTSTPKPLIQLSGKSLLEHSLASFEPDSDDQVIFIFQKDHKLKDLTLKILNNKSYQIDILEIDKYTNGQLETALLAKELIKTDNSVAIYNCDTFFQQTDLQDLQSDKSIDGLIPCSIQPGESWSFCESKDKFHVTKVTEKVRISDYASVGYYYFKNLKMLEKYSDIYIRSLEKQESYVAPLYNLMIKDNLKVVMTIVDEFKPMGTVDQIIQYWKISEDEFKQENN